MTSVRRIGEDDLDVGILPDDVVHFVWKHDVGMPSFQIDPSPGRSRHLDLITILFEPAVKGVRRMLRDDE